MSDGPRRLEQQRLEEGVGEEMEDGPGPCAHRQAHDHVAELADGGIRQHFFDVRLYECQECRHHQRDGAHPGPQVHTAHLDAEPGPEHPIEAGHQVHPGHHHGGGVDERRGGCGAGHGVRQPCVQRELGAFAHHTSKQTHRRREPQEVTAFAVERSLIDGCHVEGLTSGEERDDDADE